MENATNNFSPKKISLKRIKKATKNFNRKNLIGEGGFGKVYRGNFMWHGKPTDIAARRLHYDYGQGQMEFWHEISMLADQNNRVKHENIVSFIGFCDEKGEKIIINKLEVNESLDKYLKDPTTLTWMQRLEICVGVARALNHIHYHDEFDSSVIHGNIKSSKILLDNNWNPKLSGFEHSKTNTKARRHRLVLAEIVGTLGYVDPTYEKTGFVTHKSDIYSFGVVLFEVLCGRRAFVLDDQDECSTRVFKLKDQQQEMQKKPPSKEMLPSSVAGPSESNHRHELEMQIMTFPAERSGSVSSGPDSFTNLKPESFSEQPPSFSEPPAPTDWGRFAQMPSSSDVQPVLTELDSSPWDFLWKPESNHQQELKMQMMTFPAERSGSISSGPDSFTNLKPDSFSDHPPSSSELVAPSAQLSSLQVALTEWDSSVLDSPQLDSSIWEFLGVPVLDFSQRDSSQWDFSEIPVLDSSLPNPGELIKSSLIYEQQPFSDKRQLGWSSFTNVLQSKEQPFKLHPLFTMKRLEQYSHSSNEVLLAQLARSHYEEENLKDLIDPALWKQISPQSFEVFTETAYSCLKEQRAQRPNINQILKNLEIALEHQRRHAFPEQPTVTGEVEGTSSYRWKGENLEHLMIPLTDIVLATENFTKGFLGSGAFAKVYKAELDLPIEDKNKAELSTKRTAVAIKCITKNKQGEDGFVAEIKLLTRCRHDNIVSLLGFCNEGHDLILVYEHAFNGSLDDYLENLNNLTWVQRLKICIDIALGLSYLHNIKVEDEQTIIHRDIKSGNILLGKNLVAKIADFGLSRFLPASQQEKTHISNNIAGTEVYMCPEYRKEGKLKKAIDIYSYGVVLFEILSGKLAYDQAYNPYGIAHVARWRFKEGTLNEMIDPKIMEEVDELTSTISRGPNRDSLETFKAIAHRCVAETQKERPTAEEIIEELQKALSYQEKNKHNLQMSLEEVTLATQNFSAENRIGRGGFGDVFKGEHANGCNGIVAKRWVDTRRQGENEFLTELEVLFEYKHDNIIALLGYCKENNEKIIVYEYASNGSLDKHLEDVNLTWIKRLQICIDIVRGLAFLHGGFITGEIVIHRDLKCANILLDDAWKAKISDFGLSLITPVNQENIKFVAGTIGYVDPEYKKWGYLTKESDIYSLGVILFEIMCGKLVAPDEKNYVEEYVIGFLKQIHEEGMRDSIVFKGIKEQIASDSLSMFQYIVGQCLDEERNKRPTAEDVLKHLNKALEVQEAHEIWQPKSPTYYKEMIDISVSRRKFLSEKKKALYNMFSPGLLLPKEEVWFSLGANGERNELISARKFSYKNRQLHKWRSISESRFQKVAKMLDVSNLKIHIRIKTRFLSPDVNYGVHLLFKFCDLNFLPSEPMYVNLKYQMESETLHAYFATLRKDSWMMVELYRFLNEKEDNDFEVLLESFSRYHCGSDAVYLEGIEFRAMDKVKIEEIEQVEDVQNVLESNSNMEYMQRLLTDNEDIYKRFDSSDEYLAFLLFNWILIDEGEKLFSLSKVNGKKCHILQAKAVLYDSTNVKFFTLEPSALSRFQDAGELLSQRVFRVKCKIECRLLSSNTKYACFLVFKLSERCHGLNCPVKVRISNRKNKEIKIIYFRSPSPLNLHDASWVPEEWEDGWMKVKVSEFNTNFELKNGHIPMNFRLRSYEGTMCGLIIYGLEFQPM